jgi:hypothetical protein
MDAHLTGAPADDVRPLEAGDPQTVGGYPLLGRIGSGGMGTVYLGRTPGPGDGRVAVKTIHPHLAVDTSFRERFRDEAVLAGRVASFCTARVLAHGEEDGRPYIVSEYVGGVSLQHRIGTGGPLPGAEAYGVAVSVVSALAAIHSSGLIHRDLKPANVMLTLSGCRVIDFGIARSQDAAGPLTSTGTVLGTPGWMAPEVLSGQSASPASDIFSWGCLVAYAGTGRMPFGEGEPTAVAMRVMQDAPDLDGLPEALLPAVGSALAKRPQDRPPASDLLLALVEQGGLHDAGAAAPHPSVTGAAPPGSGDGPTRVNTLIVPGSPYPSSGHRGDADGGQGPDTAAFTVLGHVGARSTTRARVLAGAAVAAVVLLLGGLAASLARGNGDSPASPPPSSPPATTAPPTQAPTGDPGKARPGDDPPGKKRQEDRDDEPEKQKGKGKGNSGHGGRD